MNKEYWEPILLDYLEKELSVEKKQELELALEDSPELQQMLEEFQTIMKGIDEAKEVEPSAALDHRFYTFLETEKQQIEQKTSPRISTRNNYKVLFQIAAAITLIVLGAAMATFFSQQNKIDQLAIEMKDSEERMLSLLQEQSVSNRIKAVNISYKIHAPNENIISTLIQVMNTDGSTNVRLAAVEALHKFAEDPVVKNALVASLLKQTDPSLQIVIINILVDIKEKRALDHFENIINDSEVNEDVKNEAHLGIFKLS